VAPLHPEVTSRGSAQVAPFSTQSTIPILSRYARTSLLAADTLVATTTMLKPGKTASI
jgi:hypothetical protein